MKMIFLPTLRCNLCCAYCAARAMPVDSHGAELTPDQWAGILRACPAPLDQVAVTGGEPACYAGLHKVLQATGTAEICIDTNLRVDPATWLQPDLYGRVKAVNAGLQFHPDHAEAVEYWERLKWLRETLPAAQVVCANVVLWRDLPEQRERAAQCCQALGVEYRPLTFCDTFLWRERLPAQPGRYDTCHGGHDFLVALPDGTAYRCIGHAYYDVQPLGNLREGWGLLADAATPCETVLCTACDQVVREGFHA